MPSAKEIEKSDKKRESFAKKNKFKPSDEEKAAIVFFTDRQQELKESRVKKGIEDIWRAADKAYEPHTISETKGKKVFASDDELGWRSKSVVLGADDNWQEDSVPPNPYVKIQTALGIIVDRNPAGVFTPGSKKYQARTQLIENLYKRSWEIAKSKQQLKLYVFNLAKYGFSVGRTYPLKIARDVRDLTEYNAEDTSKNKYEKSTQTYYDDVFRENLNPWNVWIDDASTPGNPWSANDCMWFKDYSKDKFNEVFGHLQNAKFIIPTDLAPYSENSTGDDAKRITKEGVRVWFYENLSRDCFYVEAEIGSERIPLVNEPIPRSPRNKKLSLWWSHWTLRNDRDIEGIGIYEAMRGDHKLHTKIRAMTMDQLVQSIYKEFFYEGTDSLGTNDGIMKTSPGKGRQVINPQNIRWSEIPGPGKDAYEGLRYQEEKMEEATGVTKGLSGEVTGKTAFEVSQAREAALKRLKTPLENITDALEQEAYLTIALIQEIYSVAQVESTASESDVENYQAEQQQYREIPLNVEKDKDGNYTTTDEITFIQINPDELAWEGQIVVRAQSIIANSELLDRQTKLEFANLLVPMFSMPPEIALKPAKMLCKIYDEDPKDWLPDAWLQPAPKPGEAPNMFTDIAIMGEQGDGTVVPPTDISGGVPAMENLSNSVPSIHDIG